MGAIIMKGWRNAMNMRETITTFISFTPNCNRRIKMTSVARIISTAALFLFVVGFLWAGDVTGGAATTITTLNTYAAGNTASAGEVNQNFALLRDAVNDNDSRIETLESTAAIKNGTLQTNLNADLLDGQQGSYYLSASNVNAGTLNNARFSAYSDLSSEGYLGNASGDVALNNGVTQSNLSADMLDGQHGSYYLGNDSSLNTSSAQSSFTPSTTWTERVSLGSFSKSLSTSMLYIDYENHIRTSADAGEYIQCMLRVKVGSTYYYNTSHVTTIRSYSAETRYYPLHLRTALSNVPAGTVSVYIYVYGTANSGYINSGNFTSSCIILELPD
jgi:hypothetical protein